MKNNQKLTIHGNGTALRSFLNAEDVSRAFQIILTEGKIGETYNIGSEEEITILDLAKLLIKKIKKTDNYQNYLEYIDDRPFNDQRYYISNDKLKQLGWRIECNFETEINKLIK